MSLTPRFSLGASSSAQKHLYELFPDHFLYISEGDIVITRRACLSSSVYPLDLSSGSHIHQVLLSTLVDGRYFLVITTLNPSRLITVSITIRSGEPSLIINPSCNFPESSCLTFDPESQYLLSLSSEGTLNIYDLLSPSQSLQSFALGISNPTCCIASCPPATEDFDAAMIFTIGRPDFGSQSFLIEQIEPNNFRVRELKRPNSNHEILSFSLFSSFNPDILVSTSNGIHLLSPFYGTFKQLTNNNNSLIKSVIPADCSGNFDCYFAIILTQSEGCDPIVDVLCVTDTRSQVIRRLIFTNENNTGDSSITTHDELFIDYICVDDLFSNSKSRLVVFDICALSQSFSGPIKFDPFIAFKHNSPHLIVSASPFSRSSFAPILSLSSPPTDTALLPKVVSPRTYKLVNFVPSPLTSLGSDLDVGTLISFPPSALSLQSRNLFCHLINQRPCIWNLTNNSTPPFPSPMLLRDVLPAHATSSLDLNSSSSAFALHPHGFFLALSAISFTKLQIIPLTISSSHSSPLAVLPYPSGILKYSHGGSLLACAAIPSNKKVRKIEDASRRMESAVTLLHFYDLAKLNSVYSISCVPESSTDSEASSSGRIVDVAFSPSDTSLVAVTEDGFVRYWDVFPACIRSNGSSISAGSVCYLGSFGVKTIVNPIKAEIIKQPPSLRALSHFLKVKVDGSFLIVIMVNSGLFILTLSSLSFVTFINLVSEKIPNHSCTSLSINQMTDGDSRLIVGLSDGSVVRLFLGEAIEANLTPRRDHDSTSILSYTSIHLSPIKSIIQVSSTCADYLISLSCTGHFKILSIPSIHDSSHLSTSSLPSSVFLIDHKTLSSAVSHVKSKGRVIGEILTQQDFKLRQLSVEFIAQLTQKSQELGQLITDKKKAIHAVKQDINQIEKTSRDLISTLEQEQAQEIDRTRTSYAQMREQRSKSLKKLEEKKKNVLTSVENELNTLTAAQQAELKARQEDNNNAIKEMSMKLEKTNEELQSNLLSFKERISQCSEDGEAELNSLQVRLSEQLAAEREKLTRLRAERAMFIKKISQIKRAMEDRDLDIQSLSRHDATLQSTIQSLEQERRAAIARMKERDRVIGEKEARIFELKVDNQDLDKWKFVLDHQICELRGQIDPKLKEINRLSARVDELFTSLSRSHTVNHDLALSIEQAKSELAIAQAESKKAYVQVIDLERLKERIFTFLTKASQVTNSEEELAELVKTEVSALLSCDLTVGTNESVTVQKEVIEEQTYQLSLLEDKGSIVKDDLIKLEADRRRILNGLVEENIILVKEIESIRHDILLHKQRNKSTSTDTGLAKLKETVSRQREEIGLLRERLTELTGTPAIDMSRFSDRPTSREILSSSTALSRMH
ncbi:hypothetical protein RCL1_003423 [Eukaryota sp. TZLM3-RCL]